MCQRGAGRNEEMSFGPGGGDGSVVVGGGSVVVGGAVVAGGVVSSADATGTSAMKSATEQGRTAAVASRRIGAECIRRAGRRR